MEITTIYQIIIAFLIFTIGLGIGGYFGIQAVFIERKSRKQRMLNKYKVGKIKFAIAKAVSQRYGVGIITASQGEPKFKVKVLNIKSK